MKRQRLDRALVDRDLARSRSDAKRLIERGKVRIEGFPAEKPATLVSPGESLDVQREETFRWVGRGGRKIWPLLEETWIDPSGRVCLDVGSSTGGFTQALLRAGARLVHAVDVGYGQLDYELREDERVRVHERTNFRYCRAEEFDPRPERFTMDVSFISTRKLLDALNRVLPERATGLVLVKPQFEAGPEENRDGIVTDPSVRQRVLEEVCEAWHRAGWGATHLRPAPLTGTQGNQEYLVRFARGEEPDLDSKRLRDAAKTTHA